MKIPRLTPRNLFFVFYGLIVTILFSYLLFPSELFRQFCEFKASAVLTEGECRIRKVTYRFPNTIVFEQVTVESGKGRDRSVIHLKAIAVSNTSIQFWRDFELKGELLSGTLTSSLEIDWKAKKFKMIDMKISDVDLGAWDKKESLPQRDISGVFSFSGEYEGRLDKPFGGDGKGSLTMANSMMELVQPILSLPKLSFEKITSEVRYKDGVMYFTGGEFKGKQLEGDFSGVVKMDRPLVRSTLTVGGHLVPQQLFLRSNPRQQRFVERLLRRYRTEKLPFQVGGTLQRPTFRFAT